MRTTVRLHDGRKIELTAVQARRIHDELWEVIPAYKGAASAAIKIRLAFEPSVVELTDAETAAFLTVRVQIVGG